MVNRLLVFSFFFLFLRSALSQDVFVSSEVDRNEMRPGDTFTLTLTIESQSRVETQPAWPSMSGFQAVNTWTGNQIQSVFQNGQFVTKRRQMYHLQLQALNEGQFSIPPVEVVVDGQTISTKPIAITVAANAVASPQAQQQNQAAPGPGSDPFGSIDDVFNQMLQNRLRRFGGTAQPVPNSGINAPHLNVNENVFVDVEVDKNTAYEGQQITVSYYLYTKVQISDIDTLKYPTLEGFWKEDIEVATRLNFKRLTLNGVPFQRALLASYALFPIKSGNAKIDHYQAKLAILNFNPFGRQSRSNVTKQSRAINIKVKALPKENRPVNFSGGVGAYTLKTDVDNTSPKRNQPITLKLRFEGVGNAKLLELPDLQLPASLETYDVQSESAFYPNGKGFKEFKILLIPREEGEVEVPPISIGFFDANKESYYTLRTEGFLLNVLPGDEADALEASEQALNGDVQKPSKQLPALITRYESSTFLAGLHKGWLWSGLYGLASLALLVLYSLEFGQKEKREKLRSLVQKRISKIEGLQSSNKSTDAASEAVNLIYFTMGELSELGGASEELDKMIQKAPPSFRAQHHEALTKLMKGFEVIAFAPKEIAEKAYDKKQFKESLKSTKNILLEATKLDFTDES